jgi:hypothetical protein
MKAVALKPRAEAKDLSEDGVLLVSRAGVPRKGLRSGDWAHSSSGLTWFGQVILSATSRSGNGLQFGRFGYVPGLLVAGRTSGCGKPCAQEALGAGQWIYRLSADSGRKPSRGRNRTRLLPFIGLQSALRLRPRRAVSSAGALSLSFNVNPHIKLNKSQQSP